MLSKIFNKRKKDPDKDSNIESTAKKNNHAPNVMIRYFSEDDITRIDDFGNKEEQLHSMLLIADDIRLQIITTEDQLVDIEKLNRLTGLKFKTIRLQSQNKLLAPHGHKRPPPLPIFQGFVTWVDKNIHSKKQLRVDWSGQREWVVVGKEKLFEILKRKAFKEDSTVNLPCHDLIYGKGLKGSESLSVTRKVILKTLKNKIELPVLEENVNRLMEMRTDDNATISDLVDIVETDPMLSVEIMKIAKAPMYISITGETSVRDAISRILGYDMSLNILLGLALNNQFKEPPRVPDTPIGYWAECLVAANLAKWIANDVPRSFGINDNFAYLSGLLYNVGYYALSQIFPPYFEKLYEMWDINKHANPSVVDVYHLQMSRDEIAGVLMENWFMPDPLVIALQAQNLTTYKGDHDLYPKCLRLAKHIMSKENLILYHVDLEPTILSDLGLTSEHIDCYRKRLMLQIDDLTQLGKYIQNTRE